MKPQNKLESGRPTQPVASTIGQVWLVGAGPGDPELITLRALKLLQRADVVVYDRLVAQELLSHCRPDAMLRYVGKKCSEHSVPQDQINALLVEQARLGRQVVRLKGGDPFLFGRGGEEMMELRAHGVSVSIVPGITAALGCAAATGIPLTHRDCAAGVSLMTAHRCEGAQGYDWASLAADRQRTLAFYMGLAQADHIATELMLHGLPRDTPVALVSRGTTSAQRALRCTLGTLAAASRLNGLESPCLIMVGDVVRLADPTKVISVVQDAAQQQAMACPA